MTRHARDLVTFHFVASGGRRLLDDNALAQRTRHGMDLRGMESAFCGNWVIRQGEPHELPAQYPYPKGLMMTGADRVRHLVEASLTGRAQVALPLGLGIVAPLFG